MLLVYVLPYESLTSLGAIHSTTGALGPAGGRCQLQLGLMTEAEVEPYLGLLGQAGARVFRAPFGFNFPPVAWMHSLHGLGERVRRLARWPCMPSASTA